MKVLPDNEMGRWGSENDTGKRPARCGVGGAFLNRSLLKTSRAQVCWASGRLSGTSTSAIVLPQGRGCCPSMHPGVLALLLVVPLQGLIQPPERATRADSKALTGGSLSPLEMVQRRTQPHLLIATFSAQNIGLLPWSLD